MFTAIKEFLMKKKNGKGQKTKPYVYKGLPQPRWLKDTPTQDGLRVELPDRLYAFMHRILHVNYPDESAGFGEIDEENNQISWLWYDKNAKASSGGVDSSQGMAQIAALQAGRELNLQWHTHPSFSTYWSSTDTGDQGDLIQDFLISGRKGFFTFLVFNFRSFRIRRVHYDAGQVTLIQNGFCTNNKVLLHKESSYVGKTTSIATPKKWEPPKKWENPNPLQRQKEDYADLFKLAGVEEGDWDGLKQKIDSDFEPGMYDLILDNPDLWIYIDPEPPYYSFVR